MEKKVGRKRKGKPIHCWLIIDKPAGMTSAAVVNAVKRITGAAKAGHAGTLDPLATGVLPIAMGEATKTVSYVVDGSKSYRFTLRWGMSTETDDSDGSVVDESSIRPDRAAIEAVLSQFQGEINQVPPKYSAVKINGNRAYALARANKEVILSPRIVNIHNIRLTGMPDTDHSEFEVDCGKGAYMRSLARDISLALGTVGHLSKLRRTAVGSFTEEDVISLDELSAIRQSADDSQHMLPVETALDDIPALVLTEIEASRLRNGQAVSLLRKVDLERIAGLTEGETVLAMSDERPVALTRYHAGEIRPVRVLNI
jgi:tRNA pseudouridine55 synthase